MRTSTQEAGLMAKKMAKALIFSKRQARNTSECSKMETSFKVSGGTPTDPSSKDHSDSTSQKEKVNGISTTEMLFRESTHKLNVLM